MKKILVQLVCKPFLHCNSKTLVSGTQSVTIADAFSLLTASLNQFLKNLTQFFHNAIFSQEGHECSFSRLVSESVTCLVTDRVPETWVFWVLEVSWRNGFKIS